MKRFSLLIIAFILLACQVKAQNTPLETKEDTVSFYLGYMMGEGFKRQNLQGMDYDLLLDGLKAAMNGTETNFTPEEANSFLQQYFQNLASQAAEKNRAEANKFLEENAKNPDVTTLESGLQYTVLQSGDASGASPTTTDKVVAHYEGRLPDGTVFDSSYERGQPFETGITGVIKGWTEALQLMKPGDKWRLFIPPDMGYGERGVPGTIPPYSVLIFDIELLEIK